MRLIDKQLESAILILLPKGNWYYPVAYADILSASDRVFEAYQVPLVQRERVIESLCDRYRIRRIVPTCISTDRLETFFAREGRETAVEVRKTMRAGFERRRGVHISHDVARYLERVLQAAGESGLCGVESLYPELPHIWYLNVGDPYVETLIYNSETHRWSLGCWGDIVEAAGL